MREIVRLGEQFHARMVEEVELMAAERSMLRDVAVARGRELQARRDEELRRIDSWAQAQKDVVMEVFAAMLAENELDIEKHQIAIGRLGLDGPGGTAASAPRLKQVPRAAAE